MSFSWSRRLIYGCAVGWVGMAACSGSSADAPERNEIKQDAGDGTDDNANGNGASTGSAGGNGYYANEGFGEGPTLLDTGTGGSEVADSPVENACAATGAEAELTPINLVFIFDKSGSMGDDLNGAWQHEAIRWTPVTEALKAFFLNPGSPGLYASFEFFPEPVGIPEVCGADRYARPLVALQALDDGSDFVATLDATEPQGGTPTYPALKGAIQYAREQALDRPGSKSVVVLVTDGEPGLVDYRMAEPIFWGVCDEDGDGESENTVAEVTNLAQDAYNGGMPKADGTPSVPVYVIGIGESVQSLDQIALAGSDQDLMLVQSTDPDEVRDAFSGYLGTIRELSITCEIRRPEPPANEVFDSEKVNVKFTDSNQVEKRLTYDPACAAGIGWRYKAEGDDSYALIELCPTSCSTVQQDVHGRIEVEFGCLREDLIVK